MPKLSIHVTLVTAALLAPATARADQCAINATVITDQVVTLVKRGSRVLELCEPCGDRAPGTPLEVTAVAVRDGRVSLNGREIDLAYVYIQTRPDEYRNVGLLTRCGAQDVSEYIRRGTPSGPVAGSPRMAPPPLPPPLPRASSPDDLVGNWTVAITTRISSCPSVVAGRTGADPMWTIGNADGALTVTTALGTELSGSNVPKAPKILVYTLQPKDRPERGVLQLSQFTKDRFNGTLLRSEPIGPRGAPCVTMQDIAARRLP
jgi:hypothetical protein